MPSSEVMHKFKHHELHSGSKTGPEVKSRAQAIAIMLSEKRAEQKHGGHYPERQSGGMIGMPQSNWQTGVAPAPTPVATPSPQGIAPMGTPMAGAPVAQMQPQAPTAPTPPIGVAGGGWGPPTGAPGQMPMMPPMRQGDDQRNRPWDRNWQMPSWANGNFGGAGFNFGGMMRPGMIPSAGQIGTTSPYAQMGIAPQQLAVGGIAMPGVGNMNMAKQANLSPSPMVKSEDRNLMHGPVMSAVPGRTDAHKVAVPSGSYVVPADVVSHRGQGNTAAGMNVLQQLFKMGPYGTAGGGMPHARASMPKPMSPPKNLMPPMGTSAGGGKDHHVGHPVPVNIAGGELVIPPDKLMDVVHPDLKTAHEIMDKWVVNERKTHIKTLSKLPGPVKD